MKQTELRNVVIDTNGFEELDKIDCSHCFCAQLDEKTFEKQKEKIKEILKNFDYEGCFFDLAVMTVIKDSPPQAHDFKAEVYVMLTPAELTLDGKKYKVKKGDVINVPKNTLHVVHTVNAKYLMASIWDEKPENVVCEKV